MHWMIALACKLLAVRFFRFAMVGTAGFLADATILAVGLYFGLGSIIARIPSFSVAVLVTWALNRSFTFQQKHRTFLRSFPAYLSTSSIGLSINFGTYSALVKFVPFFSNDFGGPHMALAIASITAMTFNYLAASRLIFRSPPDQS